MKCPRCDDDTMLFPQKVNRDGQVVFLCKACKSDWISICTFFGRKWWAVHKPRPAGTSEYRGLFGMFLRNSVPRGMPSPYHRKEFAKTAVFAMSKSLTKYEAIALELEQDIVTREDLAWLAGVIDASSAFPGSKKALDWRVEDRVKELTGSPGHRVDSISKKTLERIEPYLKCTRARAQVRLGMRNEDLFTPEEFARLRKEGARHCAWHPADLAETEVTYAYLAGVFDVEGEVTGEREIALNIKSGCHFRPSAFEAFFQGVVNDCGRVSWSASDPQHVMQFLEFSGPYTASGKKVDLASAYFERTVSKRDPSTRRKQEVYRKALAGHGINGGGEEPEADGTTSRRARPAPPSLNAFGSTTGLKSPGIRAAAIPSLKRGTGGEAFLKPPVISIPPDLEQSLKVEECFMCARVIKAKEGAFTASDGMPVLAKINHVFLETGIEIPVTCPKCGKPSPGHTFKTEDMTLCAACG